MNKKTSIISVIATLMVLPLGAMAIVFPAAPSGGNFNLPLFLNAILNLIWPIFIGFSVIMFIVAGFEFITAQGDSGKLKIARDSVIYGIVGVMVGILAFSLPLFIQQFFSW